MSFKQQLKDYFDLHTRERKGLISLLCILALLFGCMALAPYIFKPKIVGKAELEAQMNMFLQQKDSLLAISNKEPKKEWKNKAKQKDFKPDKKRTKKELFYFDPNTISDNEWSRLGFNSGQIKTINNYKSKGGRFFKPNDVSKLYCISDEQYQELKPFIRISETEAPENDWKPEEKYSDAEFDKKEASEALHININTADTTALKSLSGIGPYYANKIVTYRQDLGGYQDINQLLEIWNFSPETLAKIREQIHLGSGIFYRIPVNYCTAEELKNHPYLNWSQAKAIIAYRDQHGLYKSLDELEKSHLITKELCQKIKPYLKLEE